MLIQSLWGKMYRLISFETSCLHSKECLPKENLFFQNSKIFPSPKGKFGNCVSYSMKALNTLDTGFHYITCGV